MRKLIFPIVNKISVPTQFGGGLNAGSTSHVRLHTVSIEHLAHLNGLTATHLFVDFQTAFAVAIRETILEVENFDVICKQLENFGFQLEEILELLDLFQDPSPLKQQATPHLYGLINQAHASSWLSFEYVSGVILPNVGVLAGTPPADILFCAIVACSQSLVKN